MPLDAILFFQILGKNLAVLLLISLERCLAKILVLSLRIVNLMLSFCVYHPSLECFILDCWIRDLAFEGFM